jgi:hypothetical protein
MKDLIIATIVIIAFGVVGEMDYQDARQTYCASNVGSAECR